LPKGSKKVKRTAAALVILLGLVLAVVNPDRISADRSAETAGQIEKDKGNQATPRPEPAESASEFKIIDDEGC
ncbi:MAG: sulfurtransferase, partial [Deltaproteobacteria bacterium]|nr:sulfurtransferase [Deltaproteobacteria bacterium]